VVVEVSVERPQSETAGGKMRQFLVEPEQEVENGHIRNRCVPPVI
jgi:hypothetical protein